MERGDTFIVETNKHRGRDFTCVGVKDDGDKFYAGDTNGRMFKFIRDDIHGTSYRIYKNESVRWGYCGTTEQGQIIRT